MRISATRNCGRGGQRANAGNNTGASAMVRADDRHGVVLASNGACGLPTRSAAGTGHRGTLDLETRLSLALQRELGLSPEKSIKFAAARAVRDDRLVLPTSWEAAARAGRSRSAGCRSGRGSAWWARRAAGRRPSLIAPGLSYAGHRAPSPALPPSALAGVGLGTRHVDAFVRGRKRRVAADELQWGRVKNLMVHARWWVRAGGRARAARRGARGQRGVRDRPAEPDAGDRSVELPEAMRRIAIPTSRSRCACRTPSGSAARRRSNSGSPARTAVRAGLGRTHGLRH